ncbi:MAG: hypothetical protein K1X53_11875 [Candidatus Sumerlaeaceae bacterium]|nr:hypothetical protein [Candidatus Sumerlaeaceae bacterium]
MTTTWNRAAYALLLAGSFVSVGFCDPGDYKTTSLNPQHRMELQRSIQECAARVNAAGDMETRGKCQEELCKKLVQAEEFDNALKLAATVKNTKTINPERRAAHHFMIAQIYAMKMRASTTLAAMEQNRQQAISVCREITQSGYPRNWMVGEAAAKLLGELNNSQAMAEVRASVKKREAGGVDSQRLAMARAQTADVDRQSIAGDSGSVRWAGNSPATAALITRTQSQPGMAPVLDDDSVPSLSGKGPGSPVAKPTTAVPSNPPKISNPVPAGTGKVQSVYSARNSTVLRSPIIIDGTSVRAASGADAPEPSLGNSMSGQSGGDSETSFKMISGESTASGREATAKARFLHQRDKL